MHKTGLTRWRHSHSYPLHSPAVGAGKFAAIVAVVAHEPKSPDAYRELFGEHEELVHVTVEVRRCGDHEPVEADA